jgi:hypothetical protein
MYIQLDLEVVCKRPKKERRPAYFHEFWSEEVYCIKYPQKRKF